VFVSPRKLSGSACELYNVFVRPTWRGQSIGLKLIQSLLDQARKCGYRVMRLETALFMGDAQKLYQGLGFKTCEPYRQISPHLARVTLWLECQLASTVVEQLP
jgi:ribosomal protein S18 acetylase RimI-like enzyme